VRWETLSLPTDLDQEQFLYLTTRGRKSGRPRPIEIWFTQRTAGSQKPRFYIIAEYPTANWVQNIRAHPAVQVRVAGQSFSAHARVICATDEPSLNHAVQELSRQKYGWADGLVVELIPADDSSL